MHPTIFDPTAGERARAIRERRADLRVTTDPTAGESARSIRERRGQSRIMDPTDPGYGLLLDPDHELNPRREPPTP